LTKVFQQKNYSLYRQYSGQTFYNLVGIELTSVEENLGWCWATIHATVFWNHRNLVYRGGLASAVASIPIRGGRSLRPVKNKGGGSFDKVAD